MGTFSVHIYIYSEVRNELFIKGTKEYDIMSVSELEQAQLVQSEWRMAITIVAKQR